MCIQCLQRRIESDFSDQFIFCYGLSDSPLPLGSTVVVQNEDRQFTLKFSAMEIYNEVVRDLLTPDNTPLRLLNDPEIVESTTKKIVGLQNASTLTAAVASKSTSA
ncbi:hypothetical protein FXO38_11126 [Capsicum annuum]|nr:hypothetical protein FXO38_11126 [Capsicum annuum]